MNFILGERWQNSTDDLIVVNIIPPNEKNAHCGAIIYIMAIIESNAFEDKPYNYSIVRNTDQNRQVVKTLHKNTKGVYHDSVGSFYKYESSGRVYLTDEELVELNNYIQNYKKEEE